MPTKNDSLWEGFDSDLFGDAEESLTETEPVSEIRSAMAENRQILLILFLIDVSGSMRGTRIAQVNYALENIFKELKRRDDSNSIIKIGILEFSDEARWITPMPIPMEDYVFTPVQATEWFTCYGKAFEKLDEKLSKDAFLNPSLGEYYAPLILFVTDGEPVDILEYPQALEHLKTNGWFHKSARYAIAVGEEARNEGTGKLLSGFTQVRENVRYADEGEALCNLIEYVAIRASEIQTHMVSDSIDGKNGGDRLFEDADPSIFSSMFDA